MTLKQSPGLVAKQQHTLDTWSDDQGPVVLCGPVSNGHFPQTLGFSKLWFS